MKIWGGLCPPGPPASSTYENEFAMNIKLRGPVSLKQQINAEAVSQMNGSITLPYADVLWLVRICYACQCKPPPPLLGIGRGFVAPWGGAFVLLKYPKLAAQREKSSPPYAGLCRGFDQKISTRDGTFDMCMC